MYRMIVVPVDLEHKAELARGIDVAVDLAKHYGAQLALIGVTGVAPGAAAHNPKEYDERLAAFASKVGADSGLKVHSKTVVSNDPAVELEKRIGEAAKEMGADLAVMMSHKPGLMEYVFASHAGYFAAHTELSVFIVR